MFLKSGGSLKDFSRARENMVATHLEPRSIRDPRILQAFRKVPRHEFVPEAMRFKAYEDHPLPIGHGQTISQPYVVAAIVQAMKLPEGAKVLDVGTGCGYQAAILSQICRQVYSIDRIAALVGDAKRRLDRLGVPNVLVKYGDGFQGWREYAPFDGIAAAACADEIPQELLQQLKVGGRLVVPVGSGDKQKLVVVHRKSDNDFQEFVLGKCAFVPMIKGVHAGY